VVSNAAVAAALREYAAVLAMQRVDRFKVSAYRRAADAVEQLDSSLAELVKSGHSPDEIPRVGRGIAQVILELLKSGRLAALDTYRASLSPEMQEVASRPLLDASKVSRVYKTLGIGSLAELKQALESGRIRAEFGGNLELHLRQGLADRRRLLWWEANKLATSIEAFLTSIPGVTRVAQVGSLRRKQETVGGLSFLVSGKSSTAVFRAFERFDAVTRRPERARGRAEYTTSMNVAITLLWSTGKNWPLRLVETTGPATHVERLARFALKKRSHGAGEVETEEGVYEQLGLTWIPPELRDGPGEIEAARAGTVPQLLEVNDIQGDLHMHTTASDGVNTLEEMVEAARERGYSYIAITDHSQSLKIAGGVSERDLTSQLRKIDRLNARLSGFRILKSAEVDILEDGSLDYSRGMLRQLDLTVCSIHSVFALDRRKQTDRLLRAIDHSSFCILGHATGRKLLQREGYDIDMEKVLRRLKSRGAFVEINSNPNRLDLSAENARRARQLGLKIAVNTDAHSVPELRFITAGVNQARRAWLERKDVLNTLSVDNLLKTLER